MAGQTKVADCFRYRWLPVSCRSPFTGIARYYPIVTAASKAQSCCRENSIHQKGTLTNHCTRHCGAASFEPGSATGSRFVSAWWHEGNNMYSVKTKQYGKKVTQIMGCHQGQERHITLEAGELKRWFANFRISLGHHRPSSFSGSGGWTGRL